MTRRRKRIAGGAVALVAVGAAVAGWPESKPYPCRATFRQVREGMTRAEVYATVGGPPGLYAQWADVGRTLPGVDFAPTDWWQGEDYWLLVRFEGDRVERVGVRERLTKRPPLVARLLDWAGL